MGHTKARVRVQGKDGETVVLNLLVDTGATYTWIRESTLGNLGARPARHERFETVEGRVVSRPVGEVVIECEGERVTTLVVFAKPRDAEVLGVYALEGLGLEVDPRTKRLRKSRALLAV